MLLNERLGEPDPASVWCFTLGTGRGQLHLIKSYERGCMKIMNQVTWLMFNPEFSGVSRHRTCTHPWHAGGESERHRVNDCIFLTGHGQLQVSLESHRSGKKSVSAFYHRDRITTAARLNLPKRLQIESRRACLNPIHLIDFFPKNLSQCRQKYYCTSKRIVLLHLPLPNT